MHQELASVRDTVQSIWIAIVLAFVLRAFLFEAFVIPTGSMAPGLRGQHWEITCPQCGYSYAHGYHNSTGSYAYDPRAKVPPTDAHCPNCGYRDTSNSYINGGDRVLVLKYLYQFREPQPWEVVVFKNPQNNRENYIKRLVGLPGETLEIVHGDVFVKTGENEPWRIRRKPPVAQEAMWQVVFNNDYQPRPSWRARGNPPQWVATTESQRWDLTRSGGRRFVFAGSEEPAHLRLIADRECFLPHYGYNRLSEENENISPRLDVCGDLKLSFVYMPVAKDTRLWLRLSDFDRLFRAELGADGEVRLSSRREGQDESAWENWGRRSLPAFEPGRGYRISLAHADFRVTLRVDGKVVLRSTDQQYPADYDWLKRRVAEARRRPVPTPQVGISAGGGPCELRHITLLRDVYYTSPRLRGIPRDATGDYALEQGVHRGEPGWGTTGHPITLARHPEDPDLDEFFMLGDNSPQSHDSRGWTAAAPTLRLLDEHDRPQYQLGTVPRYNLIGRAFFVYWPGGFRPPGLAGLPVIPNVGRMRLIH